MKIALVHDDLIQFGGAEKVFLGLVEIFKKEDITVYTSIISEEWRKFFSQRGVNVKTSFMQRLPFAEKLNRVYSVFFLHVLAFESFDLSAFNLVISSSSRFAHAVITRPETPHICYMHTPARVWWGESLYFSHEKTRSIFPLVKPILTLFRIWDLVAVTRVDCFLCNSENIKNKISKYYKKEAEVVYPFFEEPKNLNIQKPYNFEYFLIVTRLLPWKRVDIAIQAVKNLKFKLVVAGVGPAFSELKREASENVIFEGYVTEERKNQLINHSKALIVTQEEDFGIATIEALSLGKPVIAYSKGGSFEILNEGISGNFFKDQNSESLCEAISNFRPEMYNSGTIRQEAKIYTKKEFIGKVVNIVKRYVPEIETSA